MLVITEQETGVDTKIIEVDFLDDFVITESIMDVIKSIDVGILGKHYVWSFSDLMKRSKKLMGLIWGLNFDVVAQWSQCKMKEPQYL